MASVRDTVFLDVGGVLVLPRHDVVADALACLGHDVDANLLDHAHYRGAAALEVWPAADSGTHQDRAIFDAFHEAYLAALGLPAADDVRAALADAFRRPEMWSRPAPGAAAGLAAIAATGASIAIVSNADGQVEGILRELSLCQVGPGPGVSVRAVIDSHVVGVAKPDPRIFEIALERTGASPDAAMHVGDVIGADVDGARAAGVHPVHYDPLGLCARDDHDHATTLFDVADLLADT